MKAKRTSKNPNRERIFRSPPRIPKTARGQKVAERVLKVARDLLASRPSREVSVAEIAIAARLARASVLLQFPDGLADIVAALIYWEHDAIFAAAEVEADRRGLKLETGKHRSRTDALEYAMLPLAALLDRAEASGSLYANLQSEALQFTGARLKEHRAGLAMFGLAVCIGCLKNAQQLVSLRTIAMGEMLVRAAWDMAASSWDYAEVQGQPTRLQLIRDLLGAVHPLLIIVPERAV